jgi:photosystem II stability/assembly factor-like uncharacterized protein
MSEGSYGRRTFLKATGAAIAAATVPAGTAAAEEGWTAVETPTGNTLYDVERTAAGTHVVGAGGVVLERADGGYRTVLEGGPTGNGNNLYGADVTDDGERLWFVGASGAIGEYDVTTGDLTDHSAPNDVTNNFNDVAVVGEAGAANVYVAGDSGKIYPSFDNGETFDSVTPGSGSAINAIDFHGPRAGHAVDGNQTVFVTDDGGSYERLGIENADYNFYGVDSDGPDDVTVSGGGGSVYNWTGARWIREDTGDAGLRDVEAAGTPGLTVGGGGAVFRRDGDGWRGEPTPVGDNLTAVLRGEVDVAVGAGGTVIEYR